MKHRVFLGALPVGPVPLVVGVISSDAALSRMVDVESLPFDVAELRLDLMGHQSDTWLERANKLEQRGAPVILTLRHEREGGTWAGTHEERLALYAQTFAWISAVDCEIENGGLDEVAAAAQAAGRTVIGSFHDFQKTPDIHRLNGVVREGRTRGADIIKLATVITRDEEEADLLEVMQRRSDTHFALLGMGPRGPASRVSFPLRGSCLTYGFVDEAVAPGQVSSADLRQQLAAASPAYRQFLARGEKSGRR
jgi:3-dehydroquinate dehydratase-1